MFEQSRWPRPLTFKSVIQSLPNFLETDWTLVLLLLYDLVTQKHRTQQEEETS